MFAVKPDRTKHLHAVLALIIVVLPAMLPGSRLAAQTAGNLYAAPGGDDANDCRTATTACRTIQAAIAKAVAGDTINVASGTYGESLRISTALAVVGAGAGATAIEGSGGGVVLVGYDRTLDVRISGVTIRGGNASGAGGGITNYGRLTLVDTLVTNNSVAAGEGFQGLGGGIANFGTLSVDRSAIVGNTAVHGGGIWNGGELTIANSTISGNRAAVGGGGLNAGYGVVAATKASLNGVTIARNAADSDAAGIGEGGGVAVEESGSLELTNSLLAENTVGSARASDCAGTLESLGHNLIQSSAGCRIEGEASGNIVGQDPQLAALAQNDAPTPTHALLPGSPALAAAADNSCLATDQRGVKRPQGAACDIGAYEATADPACPCTLWSEDARPEVEVEPDRAAVELGVRFRTSVDGYALGVRFYKSTQNVGTHSGNLWDEKGNLLASVTFACETAAGWQEARFSRPVPLAAGNVYTVSYFAPYGSYSVTEYFFARSGSQNGPLYALRDGEGGANGVYSYGPSSFPGQTYRASNYWVDLVFSVDG